MALLMVVCGYSGWLPYRYSTMSALLSSRYARAAARMSSGLRASSPCTGNASQLSAPFSAAAAVGEIFTPTEEHRSLREMARGLTKEYVEPQATQMNREERFNDGLFRKFGEQGLLGLTVDERWGGSGGDATSVVIVHEEISASDPAFCLSYLAHSLLFANNLSYNGSDAQKERYLPRACTGELLGGMGMSEPGAGTDVLGMTTRAVRRGDYYELSGSKMWITNGCRTHTELGDVFLVYARTAKAGGGDGYSLFLVEKGMPGFSLGSRVKDKLGMRASNTAEIVFDRVRIPAATHLVGTEGLALKHMMRNLEVERLGLASMSLGIARRCIDVMNKYAAERRAFGSPINSFGQIQRHIAKSYAEYAAGRAYVYNTAARLDLASTGNRVDSDGVKLFCSEMGTRVAGRAIQTLGGNGYTGDYVVERLWRDAKLLEIGGGTVEAHERNMTRDLSKMGDLP